MNHVPVVAEIANNHQGSLQVALQLIDMAKSCGADFVKTQKRDPKISTPRSQWDKPKDPPWGGDPIRYIDYREQIEFWAEEYDAIDAKCKSVGIQWFASVWDLPSLDFIRQYDVPFIKIPSAKLTDSALVSAASKGTVPLIISTGMSILEEIDQTVELIVRKSIDETILLHCNSSYPSRDDEQSLSVMDTLWNRYGLPVGFSSHSPSPFVPLAAVSRYYAEMIEVHCTLDRALPGSDHAASLEHKGLELLIREIRRLDVLHGDGIKRVWDSEVPFRSKLRGN